MFKLMFKLIIYAFNEGVTSSKVIEDHAKYHKIYLYVSNGIKPSQRSIRRFIRDYGYLFNVFIGSTLLKIAHIPSFRGRHSKE